MGVTFSFARPLLRFFHREAKPKQLHPSQWFTSPTHSDHTEATEVIHPDHHCPQTSLNHANNGQSQIVTINHGSIDAGLPTTSLSSVPLFALIIGIDDYSHCRRLRGAVADAKAVKDYLEEMLGVSEDHIRMLLNSQATRDAITEAFQDLSNNERIRNGDPILIFYAGNGGEVPAPQGWGIDGKIQCIISCDYKPAVIHPIPDRIIGAMVENIAKAKGKNITVIFDCCYSANCVRDENEEYVPRTVDLDPHIPNDLEDGILRSRAGAIPDNFVHHGLRSHVLLTACGKNELAYEHKGRGQFTDAILTTLRACPVNDLTYAEVIARIHLPKQNPQCEGLNRHCVLFDARVSAGKQFRHTVRSDNSGKYVIGAGLAHGVSHGVEFTLYGDLHPKLGVIIVDGAAAVGDFDTTVTVSEVHLRNASFAKLTRVGKVPVYVAQGENSSPILKEALRRMTGNRTDDPNFRLVEDAKEAKLEVAMENDLVVFRILDQRVKRFGLKRLPHVTTLDAISRVLAAAAHYYWYLDVTNRDSCIGTHHEVAVNFYPLKKRYDEYGLPFYIPLGPGLCRKDPISDDNLDVIDFVVDSSMLYGIEVKNNTRYDLYLNAFLFNNSSFSIVPYYTQTSAGNPEAPLKRNGTFTIGYGATGTPPFAYWLDNSQDVDVGHLKIFFSTKPVDLSDVMQASPFVHARARHSSWSTDVDGHKARLGMSPLGTRESRSGPLDMWFAIDVPIVQRRSAVA